MYFLFGIALRWLEGKTHELGNYPEGEPPEKQWGTKSLGLVADRLLEAIEGITEEPLFFISETHMRNLFKEILDELRPFKEYWLKYFGKNQMSVVNKSTGMKVAHIAKALQELFHPTNQTNIE